MSPETGAPPAHTLSLQNRQRTRRLDLRTLRRLAQRVLTELLHVQRYDLGICLVADREMTRLNEVFVHHAGTTDVITFDYGAVPFQRLAPDGNAADRRLKPQAPLHGEIFLCLDEAVRQAKRFHTTWEAEVVRYLVHGLLHLRGFDDSTPAKRRRMKREEDRLVRELARAGSFRLGKVP